ncbi:MAG TPA: TIGR03086 family metal-binding protein [Mycobacteriales bacterium]|jgi:uncharacterized protein (TIGR03086 family)|nr:TIGR03086 family metal-binding protein [Mycobacteriales bacterium]
MDEMTLLGTVLGKTADIVDGVEPSAWDSPTPCSEYTVKDLLGHMVGWSASFDGAANGRAPEGDPTAYKVTAASSAEFRAVLESIVAGWTSNGTDRSVSLIGAGEMPGQMVFDMTLMEYLAHGWDLATATGQSMPYTDEEAQAILDLAVKHLGDEWRGDGKPFGKIVEVPIDAPPLDRFAGHMGRCLS